MPLRSGRSRPSTRQRNQYRIVLEVDPRYQRDPTDLSRVFRARPGHGAQVPLTSLIRVEKTLAPLVVNHQGPFPAVTITYNLKPDVRLDEATQAIRQAVAELRMPDSIRAEAAGDAKAFASPGEHATLADHRRAHLGLHRAGRALREPGASR
jgi:multidrug efflux pump